MENSIILQNLDADSLKSIIKDAVREEIATMPMKPDNFLSRKDVAKKLHISLPSVDKLIGDGKLKAYRVGGRILLKEQEFEFDRVKIRQKSRV